ncbi:MAG: adenylyltransferase [Olpidium bornovanus]|uniref:Adenylyltransferase n=1 Tax=Olpidium bornovanus TaxID=278681 RepID=A0A8H8DL64_9FUNG|nr:MAG: adenylyltransferase [Olpidium bornovanus]
MQETEAGPDAETTPAGERTVGDSRGAPLQAQLEALRAENEALREENRRLTAEAGTAARRRGATENDEREAKGEEEEEQRRPVSAAFPACSRAHCLTNAEVARYSRHLILPEFGVAGQESLKKGSVLVVGAGGLGAPVILYLAAAGVCAYSPIGIVDHDTIDVSNLHRQVIHDEARAGTSKAKSAVLSAKRLNSGICGVPYEVVLDNSNAMEILADYDVVVDCTDNPATRYLINDACVLLGKPLVSASALRTDGQLSVLNFRGVPGIMGCLEALEAIKILMHLHAAAERELPTVQQGILLFSAFQDPMFRSVRMRGRSRTCAACGDAPTITALLADYPAACGGRSADDAPIALSVLACDERASASDLAEALRRGGGGGDGTAVVLDVRDPGHFEICRLAGSLNVPFKQLERRIGEVKEAAETADQGTLFVVCRRGNDSQLAVQLLKEHGMSNVRDVVGGLTAWSEGVDPGFPTY